MVPDPIDHRRGIFGTDRAGQAHQTGPAKLGAHENTVGSSRVGKKTGRVILLNGASSSGKTTLARALQAAMPEPFLYVSSDLFVDGGMLPRRADDGGPFDWWHEVRPRFFAGFHACLPALARAGNDVIVEHVIEFRSWRLELAELLRGLDVFLVGVHCDLDEIDRRERLRGDRRPGEGRSHVVTDRIHTFGPYDLEVDTTLGVTTELVGTVLRAWQCRR
jgi:chloramphenicol 3-O phosphotransferase